MTVSSPIVMMSFEKVHPNGMRRALDLREENQCTALLFAQDILFIKEFPKEHLDNIVVVKDNA